MGTAAAATGPLPSKSAECGKRRRGEDENAELGAPVGGGQQELHGAKDSSPFCLTTVVPKALEDNE